MYFSVYIYKNCVSMYLNNKTMSIPRVIPNISKYRTVGIFRLCFEQIHYQPTHKRE